MRGRVRHVPECAGGAQAALSTSLDQLHNPPRACNVATHAKHRHQYVANAVSRCSLKQTRKTTSLKKNSAHSTLCHGKSVKPKVRKTCAPTRQSPGISSAHQEDDDDLEPPAKRGRGSSSSPHGPSMSYRPLSKRELLESIIEEKELPKKSKLGCRCKPKDVLEAIRIMSGDQKDRVRELGWGKLLDITVNAVESRFLYCWLLDKVDPIHMMLRVPPSTALPITKRAVHIVLGVPTGTKGVPNRSCKEVSAAKAELISLLGAKGNKLTIKMLKDKLREHRVDDLSIKCFFMILFNRLLFPATGFDITNTDVEYTMDLDLLKEVDWSQAIVNNIKKAAMKWQDRSGSTQNPSVHACAPFVIIYYLDNLEHELNNTDRLTIPRAALFDRSKIEHITIADHFFDNTGQDQYGNLPPMSQVGSAYQTPMPDFDDPAHCAPDQGISFQIPRLRNLLHGYTQKQIGDKQAQIDHLVSGLDTDISAIMKVILECQQAIVVRQFKFADDIKKLFHGDSVSTPTNHNQDGVNGPGADVQVGSMVPAQHHIEEDHAPGQEATQDGDHQGVSLEHTPLHDVVIPDDVQRRDGEFDQLDNSDHHLRHESKITPQPHAPTIELKNPDHHPQTIGFKTADDAIQATSNGGAVPAPSNSAVSDSGSTGTYWISEAFNGRVRFFHDPDDDFQLKSFLDSCVFPVDSAIPIYLCRLNKSCVSGGDMEFHPKFSRDYLVDLLVDANKRYARVVADGYNTIDVEMAITADSSVVLASGWTSVAFLHGLDEGMKCAFQFDKSGSVVTIIVHRI